LADNIPVRLIVRDGPRDLSCAVLDGLQASRGERLLVMDADLSHPPESVPTLLDALQQSEVDFVIGSRYAAGGRTEAWGSARQWNSRVATWLCRPLAGPVRDPMAGFFALRKETFERAVGLNPIGYKIGLELICRCPCRHVLEVPITFRDRAAGHSKLNFEQQHRYVVHLDRLYRDCRPRLGLLIRPLLWAMRAALTVAKRV
jgi:dolichol-phosphate mannosyltransferase